MQNQNQLDVSDPLPCRNQTHIIQQIQPTIRLLKNLDSEYPEVLRDHSIEPLDYHDGLVFRSAIESIRGSYIASSTPSRERFVESVLQKMKENELIHDFDKLTSRARWDFEIYLDKDEAHL